MNSKTAPTTTIQLLEHEYRITCPPEARESLLAAADYLNSKMLEIRNTSRLSSMERIAIMAALNICHELLGCRQEVAELSDLVSERVQELSNTIETALSKRA